MNPYTPPNPYQPPAAYGQAYAPAYGPPGAFVAFVEGSDLAVQKEAPLPPVCMKCGLAPAEHRRNQQFVWNPQWIVFLVLLSPIVAAVVALIVQKRGRLMLPLCQRCDSSWKMGTLLIVLGIFWLVGALIGGAIAMGEDLPEVGVPLLVSSVVFFVVALVLARNRFLRAKRIDERVIVLAGVHPNAVQAILAAANAPPTWG